jgi:NADH:ubiquinone oxidoreductase subunit 6 (subunit J)
MNGFSAIIPFLIPILMGAVLVVLIVGMVNMARRDHSPRTSNKLMQWRVALQAAAVLLFVLLMLLTRH